MLRQYVARYSIAALLWALAAGGAYAQGIGIGVGVDDSRRPVMGVGGGGGGCTAGSLNGQACNTALFILGF